MGTRLYDYYGDGHLVGPTDEVRTRVVKQVRLALLARFPGKRGRTTKEAGEIINCCVEVLMMRLKSVLRKVGSAELMEFVLYQYGLAADQRDQLPWEATMETVEINSGLSALRRGLKFIAESITLLPGAPEYASAGAPNLFSYVEEVMLLGELLAGFYMLSDRIHYGIGKPVEVDLSSDGASGDPVILRLVGAEAWTEVDLAHSARVMRDVKHQSKYLPDGILTRDPKRLAEVMDGPFSGSFGCSLTDFLRVLAHVNEVSAAPGGYRVVFCRTEELIRAVAECGLGVRPEAVRRALSGFTVKRRQMLEEERAIYTPKQEHRALRRGYFEFPRRCVPHLAWSRTLALEAVDHLLGGLCFKKLPEEWRTPLTLAGLDALSNVAGRWFEDEVAGRLRGLGVCGERVGGRVIRGGEKIDIPDEVGPLDFLGYSGRDSALVVVEAKMVEAGFGFCQR